MGVVKIVESLSCVWAEIVYIIEGFFLEFEVDDALLVIVISVGDLDAVAILVLHVFQVETLEKDNLEWRFFLFLRLGKNEDVFDQHAVKRH